MATKDTPERELGRRFAEPFGSQAWHADGTPYSDEDYRRAGLAVPTPKQLAAWAKLDAEREQAKREGRPLPLFLGHRP